MQECIDRALSFLFILYEFGQKSVAYGRAAAKFGVLSHLPLPDKSGTVAAILTLTCRFSCCLTDLTLQCFYIDICEKNIHTLPRYNMCHRCCQITQQKRIWIIANILIKTCFRQQYVIPRTIIWIYVPLQIFVVTTYFHTCNVEPL